MTVEQHMGIKQTPTFSPKLIGIYNFIIARNVIDIIKREDSVLRTDIDYMQLKDYLIRSGAEEHKVNVLLDILKKHKVLLVEAYDFNIYERAGINKEDVDNVDRLLGKVAEYMRKWKKNVAKKYERSCAEKDHSGQLNIKLIRKEYNGQQTWEAECSLCERKYYYDLNENELLVRIDTENGHRYEAMRIIDSIDNGFVVRDSNGNEYEVHESDREDGVFAISRMLDHEREIYPGYSGR